ncbi:methyltransferas-like protein [Sporormia fimetaria CBS 119925]|uniref:carnosine N-methyltransferase n=1 Tax=Sporormia fimetaria CBS 119925 TaxID=1340428 RepID=A0A6A6VIN9_9PLEO|nr:methyltransferas-like protein [Sporormia fimetaria CBS 119925]
MSNEEWQGDFDPMADPDEQRHLLSVLDSFRSYRRLAHYNGTHVRRQAFYSLPSSHWSLLSKPPFSVLDSLAKIDDLIDANADLAEAIFQTGFKSFIAPTLDSGWVASIVPEKYANNEFEVYSKVMEHLNVKATRNDIDKARSCVHQFYREWSAEGAVERSKCFDPVLEALEKEFRKLSQTDDSLDKSSLRVLVPGAGLGRLVFDICRAGFSVEGNEISYHELFASSLALNHTTKEGQFTIAPFVLHSSNHVSRQDQLRTFQIPDVLPSSELSQVFENSRIPPSERMSMATGDFCVIYSQPDAKDSFSAVATVFFIDTAPNIIRYIETVKNCLASGGLWINIGPLLWHHASRKPATEGDDEGDAKDSKTETYAGAGIADPGSVELTNEEVVALVEHFGFVIEHHEVDNIETGYVSNARSMLQNTYRPSFWIARKH